MTSASPGPLPLGSDRDQLVAAVAAGSSSLARRAAVVVALSGGPDSTTLAYLLAEARPDLALTLAHVRHGLRDDTHDLQVVQTHADWLGLRLSIVEVEVAPDGHGLQAAARDARYAALRQVASEVGAEAIAVAHTADDQGETVLLRMARGTGVAGLAGMAEAAGDLVRPLLRLRRADVRRFVVLEGLPTADDPSNTDHRFRRVAVREAVLPQLEQLGPDPVAALARLADLARDDDAALEALAAEVVARAAVQVGPVVCLRDAELRRIAPAVVRRVWRQVVMRLTGGPPPSAATVARILALSPGARADLPGALVATAGGGWRALAPPRTITSAPVPLAVPGMTPWSPAELAVVAVTPGAEGARSDATPGQIAFALEGAWTPEPPAVDPAAVPPGGRRDRLHLVAPADLGPLELRHRAPGDRVRTPVGTRRLADALVDAHVPRPVRERWPVVADADGRVIWVPGVVADVAVVAAGRAAPGLLLHLAAVTP